jgi:membrane-bound lytic murein transglycosylase D
MELRNPVFCWLAFLLILVNTTTSLHAQDADLEDPVDTTGALVAKGGTVQRNLTDADLRERLSYLNGIVEFRPTGVVKGYINTYVQLKPEKARIMLGKRLTYFPLFEQKLRENGVPDDLKYLAVVESALNPKAVSRVGATGLWQFMPSTGSDYGLRTNSAVEERSDPVKATEAAAKYLKELFRQFDDWSLALAAYNSGPGRVNYAIRKSGSRDFWVLQRFLPKETRNYVPAFIAATYICNYYQDHGIQPYDPDLDEQLTTYINVFEGLSFRDISEATGIDYEVIKTLNPSYKRDYVPPSEDGHFVVLPQRVMPAFVRYLNTVSSKSYSLENSDSHVNATMGDGRYWKSTVTVRTTESVDKFGEKVGFNGDQIKTWNRLGNNFVYEGDQIALVHPVFVQKHSQIRIEAPAQPGSKPKARKTAAAIPAPEQEPEAAAEPAPPPPDDKPAVSQFQYHTIRRNESLDDIARQYGTSVETLRKLNGSDPVKFGSRLKIRQF